MIIYEAINTINGKRYIGQTTRALLERKKEHICSVKYSSGCTLFKRALVKYGEDSFNWKIIDYANNKKELDIKESFWIEFFNTTNTKYGYNLKGGGNSPYMTEIVKRKIGNAQIGNLNHMYGKHGSDNLNSKKVMFLDTEEVFNSVTELCEKYSSFSISRVCSVCRGERYFYKSHIFRYVDEHGNIIDNGLPTDRHELYLLRCKNMPKISKKILDITNDIVYHSMTEAVGKRYIGSLSRKLIANNGECVYHNIHWKLL